MKATTMLTAPNGQQVRATAVTIDSAAEQWSVYHLSDGATVRVKPININLMWRLEDMKDPFGNPVYMLGADTSCVLVNDYGKP